MRAYLHTKLSHADVLNEMAAHGGFSAPGTDPVYAPDLMIEPKHVSLLLDLDITGRAMAAEITHTVEAKSGGQRVLKLHGVAFRDLKVSDPDGKAKLTHQYDGSVITITWDEALEAGEKRRVKVAYRVVEPSAGLYFSNPDGAYPDRPVWAGTDHETERARHWFATVDLPSCHPTLEFTIRHDAAHTALANGYRVSSKSIGDGRQETVWRLEQPCPSYITCFAVGDFIEYDDGEIDGIECKYYTTREHKPEDLRRAFGRTKQMMKWMQAKFGSKFPYPKYYQFALLGIGGAMENISLVSWEDYFVLDETIAREWTWLVDQINLHEMSHTWFGDAVICRDYANAWLKESWATYTESLWLEDSKGKDEYDYNNYVDATNYFDEADGRYTRPIFTRHFESSWDMYDRHLYPGGAMRLDTLRKELGDDVFFAGMRLYLKRYMFKAVEQEDFRRVMEEVSGRSLGRFFDQWFMQAGYPAITVRFAYDAEKQLGTFTIEQKHQAVGEGAKASEFHLHTDIGWTVGGRIHSAPILITKAKHEFTVPMHGEPTMVRFDPHQRILHKLSFNPGTGLLINQLSLAPDVKGRVLAAQELARVGTREAIEAIGKAYAHEKFWGARIELARALRSNGSQPAVALLANIIQTETDPMVMEQAFRAGGSFRDPAIASALVARIRRDKLPYRAHGAACQMLGGQTGHPGVFDILTAEAKKPLAHAGFAQIGAYQGLATMRTVEAAEFLLALLPYGAAHVRVRPTLVGAVASMADYLEKPLRARIVEVLSDLLRDPDLRVRKAAAAGLSSLRSGASQMIAMASALSKQEQVAIGRLAKAAGKPEDPKVGTLEKQVSELSDKLRQLEAKLDKPEAAKPAPDPKSGKRAKAGANATAKGASKRTGKKGVSRSSAKPRKPKR